MGCPPSALPVQCLRLFLLWDAAGPCHTASPRPSWKVEGKQLPPARHFWGSALFLSAYPSPNLPWVATMGSLGLEIASFFHVARFIIAEATTGLCKCCCNLNNNSSVAHIPPCWGSDNAFAAYSSKTKFYVIMANWKLKLLQTATLRTSVGLFWPNYSTFFIF